MVEWNGGFEAVIVKRIGSDRSCDRCLGNTLVEESTLRR